ncbi:MAG TPA: TolC family protein [Thermoanaerobaculia bacterium]|nr:TolC family protein [Thermoanaerobaculia bacterium]
MRKWTSSLLLAALAALLAVPALRALPAAAGLARTLPPAAAPSLSGPGGPGDPASPSGTGGPQAPAATAAPAGVSPPLTLQRAIELALGNAPEVAAGAAAVQADRAGARLAADAFRPGAEVSTTPGVGRGLPVAVAGRVPSIVSVDVHQSLYNTDLRSQELQARARAVGTQAAYQRAQVQTAREIADLYARCWSGQQLLAGAERRLAAYEAMSRRAAALHAEARLTDLDLAQARLREAKARLRRMEAAASRDSDLWELRRRLGLAAGAPLALPEDPLPGAPEPTRDLRAGALEAAVAADPELVSTARSIQLLERATELRRGVLAQVVVDADAQYSRLSRANGIDQFYVKFREDDWSVALAVIVPLWSGGRLRDAAAQAAAGIERVKQQQRARAEQLEIDVHRAAAALDQAEAAGDLARQSTAVAEEDLRIAEALAAEGRANPDDLDSRQAALADAREDEIKATASLLNARVQLLAVRGELLGGVGGPGGSGPPASASAPPAAWPGPTVPAGPR